jgi:histidinol-phosphate aminotransferase
MITNPPTYGMYKVVASINNVFNKEILLRPDFSLPVDDILNSITAQTKIIFICSPNNPTGNSFPAEALLKIIRESGKLVVLDEAYIDFSTQKSLTALKDFPNLVVLQTLSKAYGMAGLRIGLAAGPTDIIKVLNCIKPPYNISSASINAAIEILSNPNKINSHREEIIREREKLASELTSLEFVKEVFPGDANFLLVRVDDARSCYLFLKDNGIIVRDRSAEVNCSGCIRISIGTPNENQTLLETLKKFKSQNP